MKTLGPIVAVIAAAAIAGCSGSPSTQTSFTPSNAARSTGGTPAQLAMRGFHGVPVAAAALASRSRSWMSSDAKKQARLLYVSDEGGGNVDVYSYPQGKLEGTLTGFSDPSGICTSRTGDVYVMNGGGMTVDVYAHGGTSPLRTLDLTGYPELSCSVDQRNGNLALGVLPNGAAEINVFAKGQGKAIEYAVPNQNGLPGCAYDAHGNLYCDGYSSNGDVFALYELPKKSSSVQYVNVSGTTGLLAGPMQWDGHYMTFGSGAGGTLYQIAFSASGDSINGSTVLTGTGNVWQFWIDKNQIVAPTYGGSAGAIVGLYKYPAGGSATKRIQPGFSQPDGAAISSVKN